MKSENIANMVGILFVVVHSIITICAIYQFKLIMNVDWKTLFIVGIS